MESTIKNIIKDQLCLKEEPADEDRLVEDLGADSLDTIELVMAFEEEFGIVIPDEDAEACKTVKDVIDYVKSKQA